AQQISREGLHAQLVTRIENGANGPHATQHLYSWDDFRNPNPTDVTAEASRAGPLAVDWNMPDAPPGATRSEPFDIAKELEKGKDKAIAFAKNMAAESVVSEIPPSVVIPFVKDSVLVEHFEFTPEGQNPYRHWIDTIGRHWSATGERKLGFWA